MQLSNNRSLNRCQAPAATSSGNPVCRKRMFPGLVSEHFEFHRKDSLVHDLHVIYVEEADELILMMM